MRDAEFRDDAHPSTIIDGGWRKSREAAGPNVSRRAAIASAWSGHVRSALHAHTRSRERGTHSEAKSGAFSIGGLAKSAIKIAAVNELVVSADVDNRAMIHHYHAIGQRDHADAVGDHERRAIARELL
jgi:hypothetical protein